MYSSEEIRRQFIDFFKEKHGHTFVPSSPVIPHDDNTLLFANAGMNQFKDVFLGVGTRDYTRAVNSQKCIRAGGKHNDLEAVGKDTYHHTFFEMLGNWSFGDYFKKEAISWAWTLLTEVWGLEKDRLHATVFAGDEALGLEPDTEAAEFWRTETDIDPSHIHFCGAKDNFWEMGDTGPCGPCSEIHIDLTPDKSGLELVNADDPRVIEIWNLVFIQFNRDISGKLSPLPAKHVDTGMGFERICAVLQGKTSNYDTDIFQPIFQAIQDVTKAAPYSGSLDKPEDIAYRVLADHIRTLTFALADGALPDRDGRGYVLRRILRRAVRYGRQTFGMTEPFFYKLVPSVVESMGYFFPELKRNPKAIAEVIREEEEQFGKTWEHGIKLFNEAAQKGGKVISGEVAFTLDTTYGFPVDLTNLMAEEAGMTVDMDEYNAKMEEHRKISRGKASQAENIKGALIELLQKEELPKTEFLGYDTLKEERATLQALYVWEDGGFTKVEALSEGQKGALVVDRTPCYAESGGQVGDTGTISQADEDNLFQVEDTLSYGGVFFHIGTQKKGQITLQEEAKVSIVVDEKRRQQIMTHHTATHLLNHKLRTVLGDGIEQKGSLVDEWKTRFDFSHNKIVGREELRRIEELVNEAIRADLLMFNRNVPQQEAFEINGLRAVFGEKYPPNVRVVSFGVSVDDLLKNPKDEAWQEFAIELCGGTHLKRTSEAKVFTIVSEEGVGKGIRRITGLAGEIGQKVVKTGEEMLAKLKELGELAISELPEAISQFNKELRGLTLPLMVRDEIRQGLHQLQKKLKTFEKQQARGLVDIARERAEKESGPIIVTSFEEGDQAALRNALDVIRAKHPHSAILLGAAKGPKVAFVAAVPDELIAKGLKAGDWVKAVAKVAGGGGGGRPNMAQAGGKDPSKLKEAIDVARQFAEEKLQ